MKKWKIEVVRSIKENVMVDVEADSREKAEDAALELVKDLESWYEEENWEEYDTEYYVGSWTEVKEEDAK